MLQVNFMMIYIIHRISVLFKITRISKRFLRSIIDFYCFKKQLFFSQHMMIKSPRLEEKNTIKDIKNLFKLEK